jgi:hypothetical protein
MRQKVKIFSGRTVQIIEDDMNEWLGCGREKNIISKDPMITPNGLWLIVIVFYSYKTQRS